MKFDKEMVQKHRFWFLLGGFLLLWLIPLCVVAFGMSSKENEDKYNKQKGDVEKLSDFKNDRFNQKLATKEGILGGQKNKIWEDEWKKQDGLFTWPSNEDLPAGRLMAKAYFGDNFHAQPEQNIQLVRRWPKLYRDALPTYAELAKPAYFINNSMDQAFRAVQWRDQDKPAIYPTMEEIWYSQEDLVVRREVLGIIHNAIESTGRFSNAALFKSVDTFENPLATQRFQNGGWQLDLKFQDGSAIADAGDKKVDAADPAAKPVAEEKKDAATADKSADAPPGDEKKVYISRASVLTNIRTDDRPAALTGLHLEVRHQFSKLDAERRSWENTRRDFARKKPADDTEKQKLEDDLKAIDEKLKQIRTLLAARVRLDLKRAEPLAFTEAADLKSVGLAAPVELKGFDLSEPIEVVLVQDDAEPLPKDVTRADRFVRARFVSTNWDLELYFDVDARGDLVLRSTSKLTNIHPGRRLLSLYGVELQLRQAETSKSLFLQGDAVPWGKTVEFKDIGIKENVALRGFRRTDPVDVRQVNSWDESELKKKAPTNEQARKHEQYRAELIFWQNSPIKRIDNIELGAAGLSDRISLQHFKESGLFPHPAFSALVTAAQTPATTEADPKAGDAAGGPGAMGLGGGPGLQQSQASPFLTPNYGMERRRYAQVSQPVRRVPVCVVMIVDQAHMQEVLASFSPSNSRVHFQTTQVIWQHVPGGVPPPAAPGDEPPISVPGGTGPQPGGGVGDNRYGGGAGYPSGGRPAGGKMGGGDFPAGGSPPSGGRGGMGAGLPGLPGGGFSPPGRPGAPGRPGESGGFGGGDTGASAGAEAVEDNPNLIEVQVYGLISLYERFPPKPKASEVTTDTTK